MLYYYLLLVLECDEFLFFEIYLYHLMAFPLIYDKTMVLMLFFCKSRKRSLIFNNIHYLCIRMSSVNLIYLKKLINNRCFNKLRKR